MPSIELIRPLELSPTGGSELTIENRGSATVYYGRTSTVGPSNNIGTLKENEKLVLTKGFVWVVAESTNEELGPERKQLPVILDLREKEIEPAGGGGITVKEVEKIVKELAIGGGVKLGKPFEPEVAFKSKTAYEASAEHDTVVYLTVEKEDEWKFSVDGVEVQRDKEELGPSGALSPVVTLLVPAGARWEANNGVGTETLTKVVYQFIELTTGTLVPISAYKTGEEKLPGEPFTPSTLNATMVTVVVRFERGPGVTEVLVNGEPAGLIEVAEVFSSTAAALTVLCQAADVITLNVGEETLVQDYVCYYRELASVTLPSQSDGNWQPSDFGLKAWTDLVDVGTRKGGLPALASGEVFAQAMRIATPMTVSQIAVCQVGFAELLEPINRLGLYDANGNLLGKTADLTAAFEEGVPEESEDTMRFFNLEVPVTLGAGRAWIALILHLGEGARPPSWAGWELGEENFDPLPARLRRCDTEQADLPAKLTFGARALKGSWLGLV